MDYLNGLIVISISFAGGAGVGIAIVAFVIALDIIPRIIQLTSTYNEALLYEIMTIIGAVTFTILYLLQIKLPFGNLLAMIIGLLMGIFLGMLAAALEEVLNAVSYTHLDVYKRQLLYYPMRIAVRYSFLNIQRQDQS